MAFVDERKCKGLLQAIQRRLFADPLTTETWSFLNLGVVPQADRERDDVAEGAESMDELGKLKNELDLAKAEPENSALAFQL